MTEPIKYVQMIRTSDGNGPHPIHPDEVGNYSQGGWTVVKPATLSNADFETVAKAMGRVSGLDKLPNAKR